MNEKKQKLTLHIEYDAIPNRENINYAFQRLITNLAIATKFKPYQKSWNEFSRGLDLVTKWAIIYDQTKNLTQIDLEEIKKVDDILYDLDGMYLSTEGLYAEEAYEWLLQIDVLVKKSKGIL